MIDKLSDYQQKQVDVYFKKYLNLGLTTTQITDDDTKEKSALINEIYRSQNLSKPNIIYTDSPLSSLIMIEKIKKGKILKAGFFRKKSVDEVLKSLADLKNEMRQTLTDASIPNFIDRLKKVTRSLDYEYTFFLGSLDYYWIALFKYCKDILNVPLDANDDKFLELQNTLYRDCGFIYFYNNYCFVSNPPAQINYTFDGGNKRIILHNESGPSIEYNDGFACYHINNVRVNEQIVMHPETITYDQIAIEQNAEVRRIMIDKFGWDNYLQAINAVEIDRITRLGKTEILYKGEFFGENVNFMRLENCTPEPDGTTKIYVISVPTECDTVDKAMQFMYPFKNTTYNPEEAS